jgi:hypothetical protein
MFPAFRRKDALTWRKWKFYPGAMFLLVPKAIFTVLMMLLNVLIVKIFMTCHDPRKPLKGCRKFLINGTYYLTARLISVFSFFTWSTYRYMSETEVDYSEYLGTNEPQPIEASLGS